MKTTNKLWISSLLAMTVGLSVANGEMIQYQSGITLDTETKLLWQDNLEAETVKENWQGAIDYCENLNLDGYDDWKLPDKDTLTALYSKKNNLQNVASGGYWSSSPYVSVSCTEWDVYFKGGGGYTDGKSNNHLVRCVRDSNFDTLTFSSFMERFKTSKITQKSIILSSSCGSESQLFLVKKDGKNYFGTKNELKKQFGMTSGYSKTPFEDIQKLTQKKLNDYLTIAAIDVPVVIKDEFETKAEFVERLNAEQEKYRTKVEARNAELEKRKANIEAKKKEYLFDSFVSVMGFAKLANATFDAETSTMFVDVSMSNAAWSKNIAIKIEDRNLAKNFKNGLDKTNAKVAFEYEKNGFVLKNIDVEFENKNLVATLNAKDYKPEIVSVALQQVSHLQNPNLIVPNIAYNESNQAKGIKYNDDLAPLLKNMKAVKTNPKNWLFAIAIEKYDEADAVKYAKNSAISIITAMQKRLGISERNTYALIDEKATGGAIKGQLERLLENVKEGDNIYFYYSGHGIPSSENGEAFILPKDVIADYVTKEKEFMARNIYKKLSDSKAGKVVAFVDSCYSGKTDGIANIKGVAAGVFKTKKVEFDKSKMVVMTAGTNGQFSNAYMQKGQRLFSYFVTKALINRPTLDINSLYQEVSVGVKDESFKLGDNKRQEPQIEGNLEMGL